MKHLFTALLLLCTTVASAHDFYVSGIYYNITDATNKTVEVTYGGDYYNQYSNEYTGSVVIPESVTYKGATYSVTSIGGFAFYGCTGLTSIEIPNSVTSIGNTAFSVCTGLTAVHISDLAAWCGIDFGSGGANPLCYAKNLYLNGEKLTKLTIPVGIVEIKNYAFWDCTGLTSIEIPNSVTSIGDVAFSGCSGITNITIPNSVTSIGSYAFNGCTGLTSIEIPNSVTSIGNSAFQSCTRLTSITIPNSVTSIGNYAFNGCTSLKELRIEDGEGTLSLGYKTYNSNNTGEGLFYDCSLETLYLGRNLSYNTDLNYGYSPFYNIKTLASVTIGNSVTSIGNTAFNECTGLKTVYNFSNLTFSKGSSSNGYVAYYAGKVYNAPNGFIDSDFIWYENEDGMTLAGYLGNATELAMPTDYNGNSVTSIGSYAFSYCTGLTSITIPNSVTSIGSYAFNGCKGLTSVEFNAENCTTMGSSSFLVFEGCTALSTVTIGENVKTIPDYAFSYCSGLTSITIPNSVTSIGERAFYYCTGLKTVINFSNLTFNKGSSSNGYVAYYASKVYNAPNGFIDGDFIWYENEGEMVLAGYLGNATGLALPADYKGKSVTSIGKKAFEGCTGLTNITIPNSVTSIGSYAFNGCTGLTSIEIPNSVTSIGSYAFSYCTGLTSVEFNAENCTTMGSSSYPVFDVCTALSTVTIGENVKTIPDYAFSYCSGLTSITIPNSVTSIGYDAFYKCTGLTSIVIGNSVTSIGNRAFGYCNGLISVDFNAENCTRMGSSSYPVFGGCTALSTVTIGENVKTIPDYAFKGCTVLTSVDFNAENCTIMGSLYNPVFSGCTALSTVRIGENVKTIPDYAFKGCTGLTSITIPNSVKSIGEKAFNGCTLLKELRIEDGEGTLSLGYNTYDSSYSGKGLFYDCPLETLYLGRDLSYNTGGKYGYSPFYNIKTLASVTIGNSVTSIGNRAFEYCNGLTSVVIANSVTSIGDYAFYDCTGLTIITIPNSVTSIGYEAFSGRSGLEEVHISDLSAWCNIAFASADANPLYYAHNLYLNGELVTVLVIPDNVTNIRDYAFYDCTGLTSIEIPNSVTSIGNAAFENCTELKTVYNFSNLTFSEGSSSNGYVAYYATKVINAPNAVIDGDYIWCNLNGVNTLAYYLGEDEELVLPVDYNGEIYVIGDDAFNGCTGLRSIEIPNSVTSIGDEAFNGCASLKELRIEDGDGTLSLGYNTYDSYDTGKGLFYDCPLESLYLGRNLSYNGYSPFYNIETMTSVTIGNSVTSIGDGAFSACTGLKEVHISDLVAWCGIDFASANANPLYYAKNLYLNDELVTALVIPDNVTNIRDYAFYGCTGLTSIEIPNSVTSIGYEAFNSCTGLKEVHISDLVAWCGIDFGSVTTNPLYYAKNLYLNDELVTDLVIPSSVTSIGYCAFSGCSGLTSITIPNSVTDIGSYAFEGCTGLTSITIPNSVTSIRSSAFRDCTGLTSVEIPNSVTSIGDEAFRGCTGLTSIEIPNSVTSIGYEAFYNCTGLTSVEIPNSVTSIGSSAFDGCASLKELRIEDGESTLSLGYNNSYNTGKGLFYDCPLETLYLGRNLSYYPNYSYGYSPFYNIETLANVTIGKNVTTIGSYAFSGCSGLTSIEVPNSVTSIGNQAFYNCSELNEVHISDLSAWCNISFGSLNANPLYYAKNLYLNDELVTALVIPDNVTNIRDYAFYGCTGLTSIEIPNSVTSIGYEAFYGCTGLTSIEIPNSVTSIGYEAFYGCTELKTVYNFSNLTFSKGSSYNGYVAYYATKVINAPNAVIDGDFIWCNLNGANTLACYLGEVPELTLPADYNGENYVIGNDAFNGCTGLASVVIPSSVTNIGEDAFMGCTGLKTVYNFSNLTFGKGENTNGYVAYYADKVYNAPNGSMEGDFIFGKPNDVNTLLYYLGNTANLVLPADYKGENYVIDSAVFKDNTVITSVTIPNSVTSVGDDAFTGCTNVEKLSLDCAEIGDWFSGVSAMKEVTIGNGVTSVVASAFNGCTGLEKVCINDLDAWCGIDFGSADANPLYYAKNLYLNGELLTELSIPAEIAEVKDYAFYNCNGVTNIDIVDGVKSIGNSAFYGCSDLETLYISNTIESIGENAFAECNNILDIKIGSKKAITASENIFSSDAYNNACLYVPTERKDFYAKTSPWSNFIIREMDFTGIEELKCENGKVKTIYDLSGRAVENPANGVYIVNGKKVVIK